MSLIHTDRHTKAYRISHIIICPIRVILSVSLPVFLQVPQNTALLAVPAGVLGPGDALRLAHAHDAQLLGQLRHLLPRRPHLQEGAPQDTGHCVSGHNKISNVNRVGIKPTAWKYT